MEVASPVDDVVVVVKAAVVVVAADMETDVGVMRPVEGVAEARSCSTVFWLFLANSRSCSTVKVSKLSGSPDMSSLCCSNWEVLVHLMPWGPGCPFTRTPHVEHFFALMCT